MQAIFNGSAAKLSGGFFVPAPAAVIEVRREDTGALASIFSDEAATTPITNPSAFADANGNFKFYAVGLERGYQITITDGAFSASLRNVAVGTLGQFDNPLTTKGDLLVCVGANVLSRKPIGTDAYQLLAESGDATGMLWLPPGARAERIINGEIVESHVGNAVTYTLKGRGGLNLSATNPCYLLFPSATLTSGDFDIVKLTTNISVTVSSGSTLGHASNIAQHTFIYAIKNGSAAELAVSNLPPDYPGTFLGQRLISTTAEGGAGAADSATGIYSTTARSNVAWLPVAKVKGTQTTAGTWAAAPTQIDMAPFTLPLGLAYANRATSNQVIPTTTDTKMQLNAEQYDVDGFFDNVTNFRYQPNVAGYYAVIASAEINNSSDGGALAAQIWRNGGRYVWSYQRSPNTNGNAPQLSAKVPLNGTTDYVEGYCYHERGSDADLNANATTSFLQAHRIS